MNSIWTDTAGAEKREALISDVRTDVLIIGGGITGILCAYMLRSVGVDCIVAEAGRICGGITKNTTAKITSQHGLIYDKMIRRIGVEGARAYFKAQSLAIEKYHSICNEKGIECDMTEADSFVYSLDDRKKIEREVLALNKIGCSASFVKKTALPFDVAGAVKMERQACFHPLKFAFSIVKELPIYENTKILELTPNGARTAHARIVADKTIVATHFPFINKHGSYFLKMYQHRSYVLALEGADTLDGMYVDCDEKGLSFRNYGSLLLLGGAGHRTGKSGGAWRELCAHAEKYYPDSREAVRWATQDCMTLDGMPYIGQYSARTPNLYVATGFNKWGMSSAMVSAMLLCDMVMGKKNEYADIFSPSRSILRPQLAVNAGEAILGLITPTAPRCPHMGCALKYNRAEHTWDCSCHGSRFTQSGELIDNPATGDKK